jgi:hypothetical protein
LNGEHDARAHDGSVQEYGTSAAYAVFAAEVYAGEAEILAEKVSKRFARFDRSCKNPLVDLQRDLQ